MRAKSARGHSATAGRKAFRVRRGAGRGARRDGMPGHGIGGPPAAQAGSRSGAGRSPRARWLARQRPGRSSRCRAARLASGERTGHGSGRRRAPARPHRADEGAGGPRGPREFAL